MGDWLHGKKTVITLDGDALTGATSTSTLTRNRDTHDVTPYGEEGHRFGTGIQNNTGTMSGTYDKTAVTGPRAVILPIWEAGLPVTLLIKNEGTGTGKPQDSMSIIVTKYEQTAPAADMVTWAMDFQVDGVITSTAQS